MFLNKIDMYSGYESGTPKQSRTRFLTKVLSKSAINPKQWIFSEGVGSGYLSQQLKFYEQWNRSTITKVDSMMARYASDYIFSIETEENPVFNHIDAISIWMLRTKYALLAHDKDPMARQDSLSYYAEAYDSLINALKLEDRLTEWMREPGPSERIIWQLLRIRAMTINYQDEFAGVLIGDPWSFGKKIDLRRTTMEKVQSEYDRNANGLLRYLTTLDDAISELLKWDTEAEVSLEDLQDLWAFPDVLAAQEAHMP